MSQYAKHFVRLALAAALFGATAAAQAQTEIQWWHSMGGALGEALNGLADKFNASQKDYKVVATFKGSYPESMTAAIAAFRAGNAPHLLQVFEVGTATMMAAKGAIVPVATVMANANEPFEPKAYLPTVTGYYSDLKGNMLSFPFNSSTVMFYINKDAFKKAGLDAEKAPKTWKEFAVSADKLKASGQQCVYTTGWPSWVHVENFSAWHNLPIGTKENGFGGFDTEFKINSPDHVKHVAMLADFAKKGWFTYGGRRNEAEARFFSGECAMLTSSSAAQANIRKNAKFEFSVNFLPYNDEIKGAPQNSIIGGATLWVFSGKKPEEYKGVAAFFDYLSKPEVAMASHKRTGYLPITMAAYELTDKSGFYKEKPGTDVAVTQMIRKTTDKSRGIRLGNFLQIRTIVDEETEQVWAGKQGAKEALDNSVRRGN